MTKLKTLKEISLARDTTFKYLYKNKKTRKWLNEIILKRTGFDLTWIYFNR